MPVERPSRKAANCLMAAALAALLLAPPSQARDEIPIDETLGASLPPLLDWLDSHSPELQAMQLESQAARERIYPAGALPDPMFTLELRDIPRDDPTLLPSEVGNTRYQLRQTFPLWGKRDLSRQAAAASAQGSVARRDAVRLELRARMKTVYGQYAAAHQTRRVNEELKAVLNGLEGVTRARYETGLAPQQDVIRAQTERSLLDNDLIEAEAERRRAAARINALLARPAGAALAAPLGFPVLPAKAADPSSLRAAVLEKNPRLAAAAAEIESSRRSEALAQRNRYPDVTLAIAPIQTGDRFDLWELMFEVNIPLQQEARRAREREAAALRRAAEARKEATLNELAGELDQALAAYDTASHHAHLLRHTLLPQSELTFQSAKASYQAGRVDFATLLDAQRQIRRTRVDIIKAEYEQRMWLAEIERIAGVDL
jgi:outer membrane protein, heavy metal efflux system